MVILALGVHYKSAPVAVRERVAFAPDDLPTALAALREYVAEGAILSTCNRTEIYALVGHVHSGGKNLRRFLSESRGVPAADLEPYLRWYCQEEAVRHLFRVAAGLDSMVLGEPQILGQVREAWTLARQAGSLGPVLENLFREAVVVGKRARRETGISRHAVSVSSAAVILARQVVGDLTGCTVAVIGVGKMGEQAAELLVENGARRLLVLNRTAARAQDLADRLGGQALPLDRLAEALVQADVVITSTGAPTPIVTAALVESLLARRAGRPLCLIDIAVPRDVEPAVGRLPRVRLYNIDDLQAVCTANLGERAREADRVEALVAEHVERFRLWWQAREVVPTIAALRQRAEEIRQAELARALARLGHLSERDRQVVSALSVAIVNKLLHRPITRLKEVADSRSYSRALRDLFGLDPLPLDGPAAQEQPDDADPARGNTGQPAGPDADTVCC